MELRFNISENTETLQERIQKVQWEEHMLRVSASIGLTPVQRGFEPKPIEEKEVSLAEQMAKFIKNEFEKSNK